MKGFKQISLPRAAITRVSAELSASSLGAVITAAGLLPPRLRYGYVHRLSRVLLKRPLRAVDSPDQNPPWESGPVGTRPSAAECVLAVGELDIGGIGSVVELLAAQLPAYGVTPAVVCFGEGTRAQRIRARGVAVHPVSDRAEASRVLELLQPDVIELHGAPDFIEIAAQASGAPIVPVMHNTEIHYSAARWRRQAQLLNQSSSAVAVSELVRTFHAAHLPPHLHSRIDVIPNATPGWRPPGTHERRVAREALERTVGTAFNDDVIFVCLARYDAQKNIAGTVASFLRCVASGVPAQLVVAGEPSDWAEFRRADAIRRSSPCFNRVHLLGTSSARTLLAAADAFLLNSFFEGWPVAATEAWTAGLPLILSDVGGARELVARDPARSILVSNATLDASGVTDVRVERERWRARHQRNSSELGAAVRTVVGTVHTERDLPDAPRHTDDGVAAMIGAHARILQRAATTHAARHPAQPGPLVGDGGRKVAAS